MLKRLLTSGSERRSSGERSQSDEARGGKEMSRVGEVITVLSFRTDVLYRGYSVISFRVRL